MPVDLYARCAQTADQDLSEFFAILCDAESHEYLQDEQYWPDTWQMLVEVMLTPSVESVCRAEPETALFANALLQYGIEHNYADWVFTPQEAKA